MISSTFLYKKIVSISSIETAVDSLPHGIPTSSSFFPSHKYIRHDKRLYNAGATRRACIEASVRVCAQQDLQDATVVVVGLGVSGRAAARLALARGAKQVVGLDSKASTTPLEVDEELRAAAVAGRVRTELGPHSPATLASASVLVLSPGVPAAHPAIAAARSAGVPAYSELAFAAQALPEGVRIAAVTGTNGKSTVTTFAGQLLEAAGVRTFVGGNLGTPLSLASLECLHALPGALPVQAAVVEVSSYQMELPGLFSPHAAVLLNLTPDHLERHGTMEGYAAAKCRLFSRMGPSDLAILPSGDDFVRRAAAAAGGSPTHAWLGALPGVQVDASGQRCDLAVPTTGARMHLDLAPLRAVGAHNMHNAGAAALLALGLGLGLTQQTLQSAVPLLRAPPHRMEFVCEDGNGVTWVNDSKATNVEATLVGVRGVVGRKAVVLLGGIAKAGKAGEGLGFERLASALAPHRAVVCFGVSGEEIREELLGGGVSTTCVAAGGLAHAVDAARELAQPGDVILLSPACASFDEFTNFEHRGRVFAHLALRDGLRGAPSADAKSSGARLSASS